MYDSILVATDGSEDATAAAIHGLELADRYDASVHALSVIESRTSYDNALVEPEQVQSNLRALAEEALESVKREADAREVSTETSVVEGVPATEIERVVEETDVDLVVLGARGRSAFKTMLLGSVAETVLHEIPVPVVVVRDGE